jgi:hypothetical protein
MNHINWSRVFGVLAFAATILTSAGALLQAISPAYAAIALGIAAGISAFTERVHGGLSTATDPRPLN